MAAATPDSTNSTSNTFNPTDLIKEELDLVNQFYEVAIEFFANYTFQLIGAFLIFLIGYFIAGKISNWVLKLCDRHKLDVTLSSFLASATKMILVLLITIVALGKLGISITPFIATLGALSLGVGLALQGLLANYAAGFNIIIVRPFVVGDTIKVQGVSGIVKEVLLAYTILENEDGVEITIPNKHIVGEVLHNSAHDSLMELSVGIAYQHNPLEVINMLAPLIENIDACSEHKKPQVGIDEFGDNSIVIGIRLWVPTKSYHASKYQANAVIYEALDAANIKIPYPQRDIHMVSAAS
ncbi:mechanosensitive ion channel family protein [Thalassotalea psychrophila]|uniref:Small-conductance mechanosensitive channel n=1 Tax=Thalassotalea psychrophila TaxID=3065647 RepID=A0ABY9TWQ3_9GAMM|nr:mechanosensitive ion channel family protein [Colwelliaceae bacterium SQ149]